MKASAFAMAIALGCGGGIGQVLAQEAADPAVLKARGEAMVYGLKGVAQDVTQGIALLTQAAEAGHAPAQAGLGKILLDGHATAPDPDRAVELLEAAVEAGNAQAMVTLGDALLWGLSLPKDVARAETLLRAAAEAGNPDAQRILGVQLIGGWEIDRDVTLGLPMLEQAAQADPAAKVELGTFLLYGKDLPRDTGRALALFEEAATAGNGKGLEEYGTALMWDLKDPDAAEDYLRRAAALGRSGAWSTLAEGAMYGYFGLAPRYRHKFDEFAAEARAAGDERIEVLDATRHMWGILVRASGPVTLEKLREASDAGNAETAKFLISLLRDGNSLNIRSDKEAAREALERYGPLLTAREARQYALTLDAAEVRTPAGWAAANETFKQNIAAHPEDLTPWMGQELYAANPNVAIFVLQARMREAGIYDGRPNGYAGSRTLRALNKACRMLAIGEACDDSVMRQDVLGAILANL